MSTKARTIMISLLPSVGGPHVDTVGLLNFAFLQRLWHGFDRLAHLFEPTLVRRWCSWNGNMESAPTTIAFMKSKPTAAVCSQWFGYPSHCRFLFHQPSPWLLERGEAHAIRRTSEGELFRWRSCRAALLKGGLREGEFLAEGMRSFWEKTGLRMPFLGKQGFSVLDSLYVQFRLFDPSWTEEEVQKVENVVVFEVSWPPTRVEDSHRPAVQTNTEAMLDWDQYHCIQGIMKSVCRRTWKSNSVISVAS